MRLGLRRVDFHLSLWYNQLHQETRNNSDSEARTDVVCMYLLLWALTPRILLGGDRDAYVVSLIDSEVQIIAGRRKD